MPSRGVCPSVWPSSCLSGSVYYVKTSLFKTFSPSGTYTVLVFPIPNVMVIFRRWPITGASTAGVVGRYRDSRPISGFIECCQPCERWAVVSWWHSSLRRLLFAGDDDEVLMRRSLNVTPNTTEHHLIVRSGKSEAEVTIFKDCSRGIVLLTLTTDRHEASRGLSATAELLVKISCPQIW